MVWNWIPFIYVKLSKNHTNNCYDEIIVIRKYKQQK